MSTKLLTIEDLMERWGCCRDTVLTAVNERGLPRVPIGRGTRFYRFRAAAVEAWEAAQERAREPKAEDGKGGETKSPPAGAPPAGWDGKLRGRAGVPKGRGA